MLQLLETFRFPQLPPITYKRSLAATTFASVKQSAVVEMESAAAQGGARKRSRFGWRT